MAAFASLNRQSVDVQLAEIVLKDLIPEAQGPQLTATIMGQTASYFGLSIDDDCSDLRHIAMYLCRELAEVVRSLPAKPVDLTTDGTRATLKCGSATFTLVLLPEEEYPTLPEMPPLTGSVGSDALASAIAQVAIAAGPRRHAARADRHQDRDLGRHAHPDRHRPVAAQDMPGCDHTTVINADRKIRS